MASEKLVFKNGYSNNNITQIILKMGKTPSKPLFLGSQ